MPPSRSLVPRRRLRKKRAPDTPVPATELHQGPTAWRGAPIFRPISRRGGGASYSPAGRIPEPQLLIPGNANGPYTGRPAPPSPAFSSYSASSQRYRAQSAPFANRVVEHMLNMDGASLREFQETSRLERPRRRGKRWGRVLRWLRMTDGV